MDCSIRPEGPDDREAIRDVHRQAFGQEDEGRLVDALRDGGFVRASLVAERGGHVVGHILFSRTTIDEPARVVEALALAPMAVKPQCQREGIGSALVLAGVSECEQAGHRIVLVVGHPTYYPRFGFSAKLAEPLSTPYAGEAFMALEIVPGALVGVTGEVRYPTPFDEL